jgi:hypothetical protein
MAIWIAKLLKCFVFFFKVIPIIFLHFQYYLPIFLRPYSESLLDLVGQVYNLFVSFYLNKKSGFDNACCELEISLILLGVSYVEFYYNWLVIWLLSLRMIGFVSTFCYVEYVRSELNFARREKPSFVRRLKKGANCRKLKKFVNDDFDESRYFGSYWIKSGRWWHVLGVISGFFLIFWGFLFNWIFVYGYWYHLLIVLGSLTFIAYL